MPELTKRIGRPSGRRKTSRGSAMVEMSLIGIVFFVILIGIVDFGQFLFLQQAMVERARSAARWGAVTDPTNSAAIRNMVLYLQSSAPPGGTASFGLTADMVSVSTADAERTITAWYCRSRVTRTRSCRRILREATKERRSVCRCRWGCTTRSVMGRIPSCWPIFNRPGPVENGSAG